MLNFLRAVLQPIAIVSGLLFALVTIPLESNLRYHIVRFFRGRSGKPPASRPQGLWIAFWVLLTASIASAVGNQFIASASDTQYAIGVLTPTAQITAPAVEQKKPEEPTSTATPELVPSSIATIATTVSATQASISAKPYYVADQFGCRQGSSWRSDKDSCPAVRLDIVPIIEGTTLLICRHDVLPEMCPKALPFADVGPELEWRFEIFNSSTGSVRIRPTVIIGDSRNGEVGRSNCLLGQRAGTIPSDEDDTKKWLLITGNQRVYAYCLPYPADYHSIEWAVALVDYDVQGVPYYVSLEYLAPTGP